MKSFKIILAAVVIMFASNLLSGCSKKNVSQASIERIEQANELKKSTSLVFEETSIDEEISLLLILDNPEKMPITSAETWISYNPAMLEGVALNVDSSDFEFTAPYENKFDQNAGLLKLGRSTVDPISNERIVLAELRFKKLADGVAMLDAFDYKNDLSGHTSVNVLTDTDPVNILIKPNAPLYIIQN